MQRYLSALLFSLLVSLAGDAQSINPVFKHITRSSGLPVDEVTCIAQDSNGFMWIGTKEGLFRYDGFIYQSFYNIPGDAHTIPGNSILHVYIDSKGLLWIVTNRAGLALMNSSGKVLQVINSGTDNRFATALDEPFDVKEDGKGIIWCATGNGLLKLARKKDSVQVLQHIKLTDYHHATNRLGTFRINKKGQLWLSTWKGIAIYDPAKNVLYNAHHNPDHLSFLNDTAYAVANIFMDEEKGKVWYSTWQPGIHVYDVATKTASHIYKPEKYASRDYSQVVHSFFPDSKKNLWMGTGNGVHVFTNTSYTTFLQDKIYGAGWYQVNSICEDREGSLWFATTDGLHIMQPDNQFFTSLSSDDATQDSFTTHAFTCIAPLNNHTLLVGTNDGIYETDSQFNVKKHFAFGSIDYDWIWTYYIDSLHQQVYFSTQAGMLLYNMKTHHVKKLTEPPFDDHYPVSSFAGAGDGTIWMCHYSNDFFRYNPADKTFTKYSLASLGEKPRQVLRMYKDKDNRLWLCAQEVGLLRFDEKKEKIVERIEAKTGEPKGLLQSNIVTILDLGNSFFIGYANKGFSLYDKTAKTFRHFSQADGLVSNTITDAMATGDGAVWIATTNGMSRFDTAAKSFTNYGYSSGIAENKLEMITALPDGRIAAGNWHGLVLFHPDSIKKINTYVPLPIFTNISVYGKAVMADSLFDHHLPLRISYRENYFSVDYISLRYDNNEQIEYAYRLDGLDTNWIPAGNRRFVSFANLSGGRYSFRVRAKLPGGDWSESKIALPIYVSAAFYTQWWFYMLLAVLLTVIVYAVYRYRISQLLKLQQVRTQIAGDLHDDIGSTLTSISYYSELVKLNVKKEDAALHVWLDKIGNNARNMVSAMSDIVWVTNPANDESASLIARMKTHAAGMLADRDIRCRFEISNEEKIKLTLQQRKNIFLIYKEALNNAIKYAGCCNITIQYSEVNKHLMLQIKDDGNGFDKLTATRGNGLQNMKTRAAEIKAALTIVTAPGEATLVQLSLKIT